MIKKTIINDPVYGFITVPGELVYEIISHPCFQRLRHIKQLGMTQYVYPGALHTRFQHALGAMHLMGKVLDTLRNKGVDISNEEYEASQISILLHDLGHGPFSHTLEEVLLPSIKHESISYLFIDKLNTELNGSLHLTLQFFRNSYHRNFFHQLISSQLDIDRLDYLKRDCFFTGVQEGTIGVDRIIAMLNVFDDQLVVEEKGIYSIENFLNARRLMYWQVYLHKTSVSAERMLVNIIKRAQALVRAGESLQCSDELRFFLANHVTLDDFKTNPSTLSIYGRLDDNDIWGALKSWQNHSDMILALLSRMLLQRQLFKVRLSVEPIQKMDIEQIREAIMKQYNTFRSETAYLFAHGVVSNEAYTEGHQINILMRNGKLLDIAQASDLPNIKAISKIVKKNYLCWPKNVSLLNS
jgi:HD superfamily phosphohydrolase